MFANRSRIIVVGETTDGVACIRAAPVLSYTAGQPTVGRLSCRAIKREIAFTNERLRGLASRARKPCIRGEN